MATAEDIVVEIGNKIKVLVDPILEKQIKMDPEIREKIWNQHFGSYVNWCHFMTRYIIPEREMINSIIEGKCTVMTTMIPGISMANIEPETVQKVARLLNNYLKLYDWLLLQQKNE